MGIKATRQFEGLTLRTCHSVEEFRMALDLQKRVWSFTDIELVPVRLFVVGEKIGGHVLGAFDGNRMVGFAYGIPGVRGGHAYIHSHMLATDAEYRNRGLGRELKLFQREIALQQGVELIEWTFDPLEIKNAYLNLVKLGAITRRYNVNQYGITSSPLQGGLPSDRFVAEWWLNSERVQGVLNGTGRKPIEVEQMVEVPAEIYEWKASAEGRARALDVQSRNRDKLIGAFDGGLAVLGFERDEHGNGKYLLGRWNEKWRYEES